MGHPACDDSTGKTHICQNRADVGHPAPVASWRKLLHSQSYGRSHCLSSPLKPKDGLNGAPGRCQGSRDPSTRARSLRSFALAQDDKSRIHPVALVAAAAMSAGMPTAAAISGQGMLAACFMASIAHIPSSIACFVSMEVVEALRPTIRQGSRVTVTRIEAVVDVSEEAVGAVEPGAGADKHSAQEPIRPVVAVGSTVIGSVVEIAVRTDGSGSDVYANFNLGLRHG